MAEAIETDTVVKDEQILRECLRRIKDETGVRFLGHGIGTDYSVIVGKKGIIEQGIVHKRPPEDVAYLDLIGDKILGPVDNCPVVVLSPNANYFKFGVDDVLGIWDPQSILGILCSNEEMKKKVETELKHNKKPVSIYTYRSFLKEAPTLAKKYRNIEIPKDRPIHPDVLSGIITSLPKYK